MSMGIKPQKPEIDLLTGTLAKEVHIALGKAAALHTWLQAQTDLVALGYTADEEYMLKAAFSDLNQLRTMYEGGATLAEAKDFRTYAKMLYGFGM